MGFFYQAKGKRMELTIGEIHKNDENKGRGMERTTLCSEQSMSSRGEEGRASCGEPGAGTVQLLKRTRHTRQRVALVISALA